MKKMSLRSKILLTVATAVMISGLIISQLVTHRYSISLSRSAAAEAENIAHRLALDAADKIFINDLVALQKLLDDQISSHPSVSYLFIVKDGRVLVHTFSKGVPIELIDANLPMNAESSHLEKIISNKKEPYLDVAWPIFAGKGGVLRLGLSEKPYRRQVSQLWIQMSLATLGVLIVFLTASFLLIKKITDPLLDLSKAVENIDEKKLDQNILLEGRDEVATLASSFNRMLSRIKNYTQRLEEKTDELNRAYHQIRTSYTIAKEIGALVSFKDVSIYLIKKLREIVTCKQMVLVVFNSQRNVLFIKSERDAKTLEGESVEEALAFLAGSEEMSFHNINAINSKLLPNTFQPAEQLAVFPLCHQKQLQGAMIIACPGECKCVTKELEVIGLILDQASVAIRRLVSYEEEIRNLQNLPEVTSEYNGMVGKDPKMQNIYKLIDDVAPTDANVLIQGESGTGKELVASAIHRQSSRKDKPFVIINCSAYPDTLLESEIFGHEKGAFTGAIRQKSGRFEQADGGTVFLDEIGEIPPSAQIKLLRVLQNQKFERVGGEKTLTVDVRVLAATNKDLLQEVKAGNFREDLFYRLNVIPIYLPSLKKRLNDIPLLAQHFLEKYAEEQSKTIESFSTDVMRLLLDYHWPGNVRELENIVEHAAVLAKENIINVSDLPSSITNVKKPTIPKSKPEPAKTIIKNEELLIRDALEKNSWNKTETAIKLGISRSTLYEKIKKFQISKPTFH